MAKTNIGDLQKAHTKNVEVMDSMVKASEKHNGITSNKNGEIHHRGGAVAKLMADIQDGWSNVLTGLGTFKDKRMGNMANFGLTLTESVAEELYAGDNIARRVVDLLPDEALREGVTWTDPKKSKVLADELDRLGWWNNSNEAWHFARLYGGGGILLNDGVTPIDKLDTPLADNAKIQSLVVLERWELWQFSTEIQRDITKPDYGKPIKYQVYPRQAFGQTAWSVHSSRLIRFDGRRLPRLLHIRNNFWGDSVLTSVMEALGDYVTAGGNVANAMHDFRMIIQKIKGLQQAINAGQEKKVSKRFDIMNRVRSVLGMLVIDAEDDVVTQSGSLTGIKEAWEIIKEKLQSATDIPHNILFNEGPGGKGTMGSSGDSEQRLWYDTVAAKQRTYHRPRTEHMIRVICGYMPGLGKPEDHKYEYNKLWQEEASATADTELKQAQADQLYMDMGVRSAARIQAERFPEEFAETPASEDLIDPAEAAAAATDALKAKGKEKKKGEEAGGA